jgi:hypothetical protein
MGTTVIWCRLHVPWKRRKNVHSRCCQNCSFSQRKEASGHYSFHFLQSLPSKSTMSTMNCIYVGVLQVFDTITGVHQEGQPLTPKFFSLLHCPLNDQGHWISYSILDVLRRACEAWFPAKASAHSDSQSQFSVCSLNTAASVCIHCNTQLR